MNPQAKTKAALITELLESGTPFSVRRAEELAEEWMAIQPESSAAHVCMGLVAGTKGDEEKAFRCFLKATEVNPEDIVAWKNLATSHQVADEKEKAVESAEKALELSRTTAERLDSIKMIGVIHLNFFHFEKAAHFLSQIVEEGFRCYELACCYWMDGKIKEMLQVSEHNLSAPELPFEHSVWTKADNGYKAFLFVYQSLVAFLVDGYSPEQIYDSIDLPPVSIQPRTKEYAMWWLNEVGSPDWQEATVEIIEDTIAYEERAAKLKDTKENEGLSPIERALKHAPVDDEPLSDKEEEALAEAREDIRQGKTTSHEDFMREMGLL